MPRTGAAGCERTGDGRPDQLLWLNRLETEHDNIRAALTWSPQQEEIDAGLQLAGTLWLFWELRSHLTEGSSWLTRLLDAASGRPVAISSRAKALVGAGSLALRLGDPATARSFLEEGVALYRTIGDRHQVAHGLNNLGNVALEQGDLAAARPLYEESLAIKREVGDEATAPATLNNLAILTAVQGDYEAARTLHAECLAIRRERRDLLGVASSLFNLGKVIQSLGDDTQAIDHFRESLVLSSELGERRVLARCLEGIAYVAGAHGRTEPAVRLFAAPTALREAIHSPLLPPEDSRLERSLAGRLRAHPCHGSTATTRAGCLDAETPATPARLVVPWSPSGDGQADTP